MTGCGKAGRLPAGTGPGLCLISALLVFSPVTRAEPVIVSQADGSDLVLGQPATRIMTLSPHLTELVYAAGAGDQLIATVEYSDYPEAADSLPRIGDAFRLDSERILALNPDLVIAWDSGNPRPAIEQLRSLGLTVWTVEIREPLEIADALDAMGRATGHESTARRESAIIRQRLQTLSTNYRGAKPLNYFYQIGAKPLFTINGDHLISKGLGLCGASNIFGPEAGLAFQVGYESVIAADPDALFAPYSGEGQDPLALWREWPAMKAVQSEALFLLPADAISRATPRFLSALEQACKLLDDLRR